VPCMEDLTVAQLKYRLSIIHNIYGGANFDKLKPLGPTHASSRRSSPLFRYNHIMLNEHKASSHSFTAKTEPAPTVDVKPSVSPPSSPPPKKASPTGRKRVKASASPSSAKKPKKDSVEDNGSWTLDKRAGFLEDVLVAGYKSADFDALATKVRGASTGHGVFAP